MQMKKLLLLFIPLFMINSTLPMWRRATTTQSRSLAPRFTRSPRTAALFSQARRPATRVIEQRTNTPIRKRIFSSQRSQNRAAWFDWSKWKRNAWVVGATLFGAGVSQQNSAVHADEKEEITLEWVENRLGKPEWWFRSCVYGLTDKQLEQLNTIIIKNFVYLNSWGRLDPLLKAILFLNPELAFLFAQPVINNITQINPGIVDCILDKKPEAAEHFVQPVINNITQINTDIVYCILDKKPEAAEHFVQAAINNITQINTDIVYCILDKKPEAAQQFVQPAIDNITTINWLIIAKILDKRPELAQHFVQPAINNITQINPEIVGSIFINIGKTGFSNYFINLKRRTAQKFIKPVIDNITKCDSLIVSYLLGAMPKAAEHIAQAAINNITQINTDIVYCILGKKPEAAEHFVQAVINNITQINPGIVRCILDKKPEAAEHFVQPAINNITQINPDIVRCILDKKPEAAEHFVQPVIENIEKIKPSLLLLLPIECDEKTKETITQLQQKESNDIATIFKILILSKKICKQPDCKIKCCTHTCAHLKQNFHAIKHKYIKKLLNLSSQVNQKEKELQENYYTFVHGQRWKYQFTESLFTKLYEWTNRKELPEFLFAHIKKLPENIADEELIHKKLLSKGRTNDYKTRQRLLFLNYAFFGSSTNRGSCTASYVASNSNVGTIRINMKQLFQLHNLEHTYEKYKNELTALQKEHAQLSKMGNLLLIAIPKDFVDQCVFPVKPGGYRKTVVTEKGRIWNSRTNKASELLEAIKSGKVKDTDRQEFCLIMTNSKYGGLNPESGIKIFDFNTVDEEKWAAYKEKEDALFEKIKADILASQAEDKSSFAKASEDKEMVVS